MLRSALTCIRGSRPFDFVMVDDFTLACDSADI